MVQIIRVNDFCHPTTIPIPLCYWALYMGIKRLTFRFLLLYNTAVVTRLMSWYENARSRVTSIMAQDVGLSKVCEGYILYVWGLSPDQQYNMSNCLIPTSCS